MEVESEADEAVIKMEHKDEITAEEEQELYQHVDTVKVETMNTCPGEGRSSDNRTGGK